MTRTPTPGEVWLRRRDNAQVIVVADPAGARIGETPAVAWRALTKGRLNRTSLTAWGKKFTPIVRGQGKVSSAEEDRIRALLMGRRIVGVEDGRTLVLETGVRLDVEGNHGCSGCESGNYAITRLEAFDNAITRAEFPYQLRDDPKGDGLERLQITVYAEGGTVPDRTILTAVGTRGNGYYGSGFTLIVRSPPMPREQPGRR